MRVLRRGQRSNGRVRERRPQQLERVEVDLGEVRRDPGRDLGKVVPVERGENGLHVDEESAGAPLQSHEPAISLRDLREIAGRAADFVVAVSYVVERQPHGERLTLVRAGLESSGDDRLDLLRKERVRRHRDVRRVVAAIEQPGHARQVAVQRRLPSGQDHAVERREVLERAPVVFERHLQVPVDVQVVPVEARHTLRVAEVGHSQDEVARQRLPAAEPLPGERELVQRAATASRPRAMPASNPAK